MIKGDNKLFGKTGRGNDCGVVENFRANVISCVND